MNMKNTFRWIPTFCLVFLFLISSLAPLSNGDDESKNYWGEIDVLDPNLKYHLENDKKNEFEVLIQFKGNVLEEDIQKLEKLKFKIFEKFDVIPMVFAKGSRESIYELSKDQRIFWIEYNAPMKYYMNVSAYTIQAKKVLEREIILPDGERLDPIDGSGVTVVVLDSGIDGTHPDLEYTPINLEAGEKPRKGMKVIYNVKKDQNATGQNDVLPWIPMEDTDTTSGHGTHVAGTVAGTGDASAGDVMGIAPGAWLIGLSMGELFATIDEFQGLKWVYEHSRPGNNPANIRVVTNSWGPGEPFDNLDPNDASIRMIEKIVYENNVAVIFAAGNDGRGDEDGREDTVNIFGKVPAAICVAAAERDGSGIAEFSSRGNKDKVETYPDVAAPGVKIWSAAATKTIIGAMVQGRDFVEKQGAANPYYLAISGTSMATPHVAGVAALLWQACPSLKVSEVDEDFEGEIPFKIKDVEGDLYSIERTKIHEIELILKLTADYIEPDGENLVPEDHRKGILGKKFDYAQGYGLVNADRAVALALYLNHLRDPDSDGEVEHPDVSVLDAYKEFKKIMVNKEPEKRKTDVISTIWQGKFVDMDKSLQEESEFYGDTIPAAIQKHKVFVPETAREMKVSFTYYPYGLRVRPGVSLPSSSYADLTLTIDANGDGEREEPSGLILPGTPPFAPDPLRPYTKTLTLDLTTDDWKKHLGQEWTFDVYGYALSTSLNVIHAGVQCPYTVEVKISLSPNENTAINKRFYNFEEPSELYKEGSYSGTVSLPRYYYDLGIKGEEEKSELVPLWFMGGVIILAVLLIALAWKMRYRKDSG